MLFSWKRSFVAVALVGTVAVASSAQSVDAALLARVTSAVENTLVTSSLQIATQSQTQLLMGQLSLTQNGSSEWVLAQGTNGWNAQGSTTNGLSTPMGEFEITNEIIVLDDTTYARIGEMPAMLNALQGQGGEAVEIPEGWFEVSADNTENPIANVSVDATSFFGVLAFPLSEENIVSLAEIAPDEIDGQAMQVIQVTVDAQAVAESEAAGLLVSGAGLGGFGAGGGFPQGGQLPEGAQLPEGVTPPANPEDMQTPDFSNAQITFALYIGQDDGLVHRIYSVVLVEGVEGQGGFSTTSLSDYSAFDEAVTIVAPEIGS
jgi:hypothetical protein